MTQADAKVLVRARGLQRRFQSGDDVLEVLTDVSLEVRGGELVLLMGPSGSGKTTLLSILAGLMRPNAGEVEIAGRALGPLSESDVTAIRRKSVGFVFQSFRLFEALDARDNVAEVLAMRGVPIAEARVRAAALLDRFGLGARLRHAPRALSAGQKQRVAIARAFAASPEVVFGDEPTAALDHATALDVMALLRAETRAPDRCGVVVTHDEQLTRFADRVVRLAGGKIVEDGAVPAEVAS